MRKREYFLRGVKCIAATSVKVCNLSICQHLLRKNTVVIVDEARCLTSILITTDDRMNTLDLYYVYSNPQKLPGNYDLSVCHQSISNCLLTTRNITV